MSYRRYCEGCGEGTVLSLQRKIIVPAAPTGVAECRR